MTQKTDSVIGSCAPKTIREAAQQGGEGGPNKGLSRDVVAIVLVGRGPTLADKGRLQFYIYIIHHSQGQ